MTKTAYTIIEALRLLVICGTLALGDIPADYSPKQVTRIEVRENN